MNAPANRRSFLRGLTTLPLIGGGIALIGAPSAVAQPVSTGLLMAYDEWLFMERRMLCLEQCPATILARASARRTQALIPITLMAPAIGVIRIVNLPPARPSS